jgi:hypothetical protein
VRPRKWTIKQLEEAAKDSRSIRQVLKKLGLKEAGGNYSQINKYLRFYKINTSHFKGRGWSKGLKIPFTPKIPLEKILVKNSDYQSYKLKSRLIRSGLKKASCELCGWAEKSLDGRIPLELDHINGDSLDNRIENLRILCPNCHSLQPTHRGRNTKN